MTTIKNFAKVAQNFVSQEVSSPVLEAGEHAVRLINAAVIHSKIDNKGNPKENADQHDYDDVTTQLYCEFGSVENKGAIAHRFNMEGFARYDDLTSEEKESGKFEVSAGPEPYALQTNKDGSVTRVPSEKNTEAAQRILSQAFKTMGLPAGSTLDDLQTVIDEKREFIAVVREREYNGKVKPELHYLKEMPVEAPVTDDSFAE